MITDADIARICVSSYDSLTKWDKLWEGGDSSDIFVGMIGNVLCFRGSVTAEDWFRDLDAIPVMDPLIGGLHAGFAKGLQQFHSSILQFLRDDTIICGHSLGAARALIFGGYMAQAGLKPRAVITFGSPLPGFMRLAEILQPVTVRSYKNRYDPVTDVPIPLFPTLPYVHPRQNIQLDVPPAHFNLDLLADHSIQLYATGTPQTEI